MGIRRKLAEATVGDSTHVAQVKYDEDGKIISATAVAISVTATLPTGVITAFGGSVAPSGFVLCDGTSYLRAGAMAALFAVIGTTYGSADGTHFNVPDLQERFPLGKGTTHALGATGGATTHSHGVGSYTAPNHSHAVGTIAAGSHTHGSSTMAAAIEVVNGGAPNVTFAGRAAGFTSTVIGAVAGPSATALARSTGAAVLGTTDATTPSMSGSTASDGSTAVTGTSATAAGPIDPFVTVNFIIAT